MLETFPFEVSNLKSGRYSGYFDFVISFNRNRPFPEEFPFCKLTLYKTG